MVKRKIKRKIVVPIRLSTDMVKELDILAIKLSKYRSEIVREAVLEYLYKYKNI